MGKSTGLTVAVVGGIAAGIVALILLICYKRWKLRKQSASLKPWAPIKKRPRIAHPPIPKPAYRTDKVTVSENGMKTAQEYVEESHPAVGQVERSPRPHRRMKPYQSSAVQFQSEAGDMGGTAETTKHTVTSRPPSLSSAGKTQSLNMITLTGTLPIGQAGRRLSSVAYDPLDPFEESETDDRYITGTQGSMVGLGSVSESAEEASDLGQLQFRLEPYQYEQNTFRFHLICANNLQSKNFGGSADPFAVVYLVNMDDVLPSGEVAVEKAECWRSKTHMKTLDPVFDEHHDFSCPSMTELMQKAIYIHVFDYDRFSRNELIGHIWLPLHSIDISNIPTFKKGLQQGKRVLPELATAKGKLQVSLAYSKSAGHVTGFVLKAQQLGKMYNPFVKIDLMHQGQRVAKKRTPTQKHTDEPIFNEDFTFELGPDRKIEDCGIVFILMDRDMLHKNILGCVSIGPGGQDSGQTHWTDMIGRNGRQVIRWHDLQRARRKTPSKLPARGSPVVGKK